MIEITHARTGALEDLSPGGAEIPPAPGRAREWRPGAISPRDAAAAPAEARVKPAPARRCVTARAVRSDMLLVLLAAVVAVAALGCGHACNYGFSPCTAVSSASPAPSPSGETTCPTEYRPLCLGKDSRCVTDKNGCQVCDCVESGSPVTTPHPRDVHDPREGR